MRARAVVIGSLYAGRDPVAPLALEVPFVHPAGALDGPGRGEVVEVTGDEHAVQVPVGGESDDLAQGVGGQPTAAGGGAHAVAMWPPTSASIGLSRLCL